VARGPRVFDTASPHKLAGGAVIVKPGLPRYEALERCTSMGMGTVRLTAAARARGAATPIPL
jgi:hypothetical protein